MALLHFQPAYPLKSYPFQHHLQHSNPPVNLHFPAKPLRLLRVSADGNNLPAEGISPFKLTKLGASSVLLLCISSAASALAQSPSASAAHLQRVQTMDNVEAEEAKVEDGEKLKDKQLQEMFENWKSKTYALTVPLTIVALRGSIPPSWTKDFIESQGKRVKFRSTFREDLRGILSDMCVPDGNGKIRAASTVAADMVSVGDSWLNFAISKAVIEPLEGIEAQEWFKDLSDKWKIYLRRNNKGELDREGKIWAAPYRWGTVVIAYKKSKFQKHNLAPIEDWADLWRSELAGRISMFDSPREVVGLVLKYMGASYNTRDINTQVAGGMSAVQQNLEALVKQVRLFDSTNYLKAFGVGDAWVAVGWSSDVLPAVKRMSNVAVIVPKSGSSLWADLWAIPAASRLDTDRIGGRVRGPSLLIHQWIEFCLQPARALPFKQEIVPGASPSALEGQQVGEPQVLTTNKPKLETNLNFGVPPPEILGRCEFLEPLSDGALSDYQKLLDSIRDPGKNTFHKIQHFISSKIDKLLLKLNLKH